MTQSAAPDLVTVPRENIAEALTQACEYFENRADVVDGDYGIPEPNTEMRLAQMCSDALSAIPSSDPEGGARGELNYAQLLTVRAVAKSAHAKSVDMSVWHEDLQALDWAVEFIDAQLTNTPSADHDDGNLRGLAEPNHQPHAVSQGWQDIETAPRDGSDFLASTAYGVRLVFWDTARGGVWSVWPGRDKALHPTHWIPLPAPPSPAKTDPAPSSVEER